VTSRPPEYHVGSSYFVRMCLIIGGWRFETNQVEIRMVPAIVGAPLSRPHDATVPAGTPLITGYFGPTPARPGDLIRVTGLSFGDRPGQMLFQVGAATYFLTDLDWHRDSIAGRVPGTISGVPDGPAFLTVERADRVRSGSRPIHFMVR
jgi:hypothetical protein